MTQCGRGRDNNDTAMNGGTVKYGTRIYGTVRQQCRDGTVRHGVASRGTVGYGATRYDTAMDGTASTGQYVCYRTSWYGQQ